MDMDSLSFAKNKLISCVVENPKNSVHFSMLYELCHEKTAFCLCKNKDSDFAVQFCAVTAQPISAFVFATRIVQFLLYLCPRFQDSNLILRLYRSVCVRPGS